MRKNLLGLLACLTMLAGCAGQDSSLTTANGAVHKAPLPIASPNARPDLGLGFNAASLYGGRSLFPPPAGLDIPHGASLALKNSQLVTQAAPLDPEALAAARRLQEITHTEQQIVGFLDTRIKVLKTVMVAANPGASTRIDLLLQEILLQRFEQLVPTFLDLNAREFARHFTAAELKQLAEFYSTPLGAKVSAEMPEIQQEIMVSIQPLMLKVVAGVVQDLKSKAAARGLNMPHNI